MEKPVDLMESHLRLGEILLNLGRIEEARIELSLAKDIANKAPDATEERQKLELEKLQQVINQLSDQSSTQLRLSKKSWIALFSVTLLAALVFFGAWVLSRAAILELRNNENAQDNALTDAVTLAAESGDILLLQGTAAANRLEIRDSELRAISIELTQSVQMVTRSAETLYQFATLAAEKPNQVTNAQPIVQTVIFVATPTPGATSMTTTANAGASQAATPAPSVTTLTTTANHQLRITEFRANFRTGPGFGYRVKALINQNDIVTALAYSRDYYWYYVENSDGETGWVHSSLAKPLLFVDELPITGE